MEKIISPLFLYSHFKDFFHSLVELKNLAITENWNLNGCNSNKILLNFILHTFSKIKQENKIVYSNSQKYSCFNTGLLTENYENIYGFFVKNKNPNHRVNYFFLGWKKESDNDLLKFNILPDSANYFHEPSNLLYDPNLDLRVNLDHILNDNYERFPEELKQKSKYEIRNNLMGAIELIKKKVKMNYKTAIPQYFNSNIQLLLPLCFSDKQLADLALVVNKNVNFYTGRTCLTLEMAYNNARLIARPDQEWLKV